MALASFLISQLVGQLAPALALLGVPLAAALAVWMCRSNITPVVETSAGLRIGLVHGFFSFIVVMGLTFSVPAERSRLFAQLKQAMEQGTRDPNPQTKQFAEWLMTPEGLVLFAVVSAIFGMVVFLILSATGGAIAGSALRPRSTRS
jgi:hypothetical protein